MKKILLLFVFVVGALAADAQTELTEKERSYMDKLKVYLTEEGYIAKLDEDNDLAFKKEGDTYWISVTEEKSGCYFVRLASSMGCEDTNLDAVRKAVNQVNSEYKLAKAYLSKTEKNIQFVIDAYCYTSEDFTKYFAKYMDILDDVDGDLKEYYGNYDKKE